MSYVFFKDLIELLTNMVTIFGLPMAILIYYQEKRKERRDREYGTYNALDDKYIQFLELCLEHPDLDVFDLPIQEKKAETPEQRRQQQVMFTILISILERAFLMYRDQSTDIKKKQWTGWVDYMKDYCTRNNFRSEWEKLGKQFDAQFVDFINHLMHPVDIETGSPHT